ncbi:MAG: formimidoylglutamate deiminase [Pseudomonadota bacterium]|nr:formimidoylglutamate deiminase [Pseudomonadota bacterium]
MTGLWFAQALLPGGWGHGVRILIEAGRIVEVESNSAPEPSDQRFSTGIPGLPNLHSHVFQRAMAGLAEAPGTAVADDFWSWRDQLYQLVSKLGPDEVRDIAAMAFVEMLETGFTRVGEFHYLHHVPGGTPYAHCAEMAAAIAAAAQQTGIALTLLPVFYAHSGFGGQPPNEGQKRFVTDLDGFARLLDQSQATIASLPDSVLGIAAHSLRAVSPGELEHLPELVALGPVHIHIAEQQREVADCLDWCGARPVRWLIDHMPVNERWCLVHATHVDPGELAAIARSGAVVGLCPITEANLGDGLFPADEFVRSGGRFGIGSDSNVHIDAAEELRLLEYGQRLRLERRNVLALPPRSTGRSLFDSAFAGGARALGADYPGLAEGAPADIVALSRDPAADGDRALDRWIFAPNSCGIEAVWRAGVQVVADGRHRERETVEARFATALGRIAS